MSNSISEYATNVRDNYITGRREVLYGDKVVESYSAEMVGIINKQSPGMQPPFGFFIEDRHED